MASKRTPRKAPASAPAPPPRTTPRRVRLDLDDDVPAAALVPPGTPTPESGHRNLRRRNSPAVVVAPSPAAPVALTPASAAFELAVRETAEALYAAKRVAVVAGAGISVSAGIPDFRSEDGLYRLAKTHAPPGTVVKGQDLFDAGVFRAEPTTRLFFSFMAGLRDAAEDARPTPAHHFLRRLSSSGKLLRCYTQNIDGLEDRAGVGAPVPPTRPAGLAAGSAASAVPPSPPHSQSDDTAPLSTLGMSDLGLSSSISLSSDAPAGSSPPRASVTAKLSAPTVADTVVQLHGTLSAVRCNLCRATFPFTSDLAAVFSDGDAPACPTCAAEATQRAAQGKRARATGTLRPDVVLYNEAHPYGDAIADVVSRDVRRRPDLVIVMGTSLKVHGIKRLVRDLATAANRSGRSGLRQAANAESSDEEEDDDEELPFADITAASSSPERRTRSGATRRAATMPPPAPPPPKKKAAKHRAPRVILVNRTPMGREWADVFDHVLLGDADDIVARWSTELDRLERAAADRRAKRELNKARKLGQLEPGQTRLPFPVVKNSPMLAVPLPAVAAAIKHAGGRGAIPPSAPPLPRRAVVRVPASPSPAVPRGGATAAAAPVKAPAFSGRSALSAVAAKTPAQRTAFVTGATPEAVSLGARQVFTVEDSDLETEPEADEDDDEVDEDAEIDVVHYTPEPPIVIGQAPQRRVPVPAALAAVAAPTPRSLDDAREAENRTPPLKFRLRSRTVPTA
ncbi:NAD-dependent deacetylase hst3 [Blastocladiella emersonii ATCC 22665]|nr:NAD-dependent deacetylase hst3 [Blastocladiella emersonii ATCC 22665]